jgi:asparagine synthase (glutamine-hydrolysing)
MRPRYLLAVACAGRPLPDAAALAARIGLDAVAEVPSILVFANAACRPYVLDQRGVVLGTLFWRHGPAQPIDMLSGSDASAIPESGGDRLLTACWGGYVAALPAGEGIRVLRDPSATLSCYYSETPRAMLFASDVDLLLATGLVQTAIDWAAVGRHHYAGALQCPATALAGIRELLPGCAIAAARGEDQQPRWSPWDHVHSNRGLSAAETAERLRRTVMHCVRAWASSHKRLLVSVSGGLDSSIVAACLAGSGHDVGCITMYTDDPAGDERAYARALCRRFDLPLAECRYRIEDVDIDQALSPHLPRPIGRTLAQAYERAHLEAARELGIDAFVTGSGGDNVFGYSQSAAAIADRWLSEGFTTGLLATLRDVCRQTGCSSVEALRAALRARRRQRYHWRPAPAFLHRDVLALGEANLAHPWIEAPPDALPGKAAHVAALLRVLPLLEPGRSAFAPVLYPLVSQPVVEACLAIPSWAWREGGRDRAVARRAFADDLPALVLERRVKGGPDGFGAALLRLHRVAIRERLLDGELARHGIVDRTALEAQLGDERPLEAALQVRILDLLDTEAWAATWSRRLSSQPQPADAAACPNG